jgi:hypothetical protein
LIIERSIQQNSGELTRKTLYIESGLPSDRWELTERGEFGLKSFTSISKEERFSIDTHGRSFATIEKTIVSRVLIMLEPLSNPENLPPLLCDEFQRLIDPVQKLEFDGERSISEKGRYYYDPSAVPIWELAAQISAQVPDEEWEKLPTDLARRFDDYQQHFLFSQTLFLT